MVALTMTLVTQRSRHEYLYYDADIQVSGTTLIIPATTFYLLGVGFALPAYTPNIGTGPFRLWIEASGSLVDYFLDLTLEGTPESLGPGIGSHIVAWRDTAAEDVHVLRSVPDAA